MGKYADAARAAYAQREQAAATAAAAARQALVDRARVRAKPLWTDATGKVLLGDVTKDTRAEFVDMQNGLVILSVLDSGVVEVSFAVYPDKPTEPMRVATKIDGQWQGMHGPIVADLDDVGEALAGAI